MMFKFSLFIVLSLFVPNVHGACAEVDSATEAIAGEGFLLGCISCKRREEVSARTTVDWHFRAQGEDTFTHIFHYEHPQADVLHEDFSGRLEWHGTPHEDVQIGAVYLSNVTFNDTGTFRCSFHRTLSLLDEEVTVEKDVELTVVAVANRELTAVISEIMMYVLIVVLQLWLIVVLVYCYKKISADHERREAKKALKAQELALLETNENSDDVHLE